MEKLNKNYMEGEKMPNPEKGREIARNNFLVWENSLATKDQNKVAGLYSDDATFLPTVSGEFKKGRSGAEEYFKHFLEKDPRGQIVEDEVQFLSSDAYLHSGLYNFEVGPAENRTVVEARFSFVWKKDKSETWKIAHHHSSIKPQA